MEAKELKEYIDAMFDSIRANTLIGVKNILTAEEAAAYTGYSMKGIYSLTCERRIPHYKRNGKLYFDKSELDLWMTTEKVKTTEEIEREAERIVTRGNRKRI